MQGALRVLLGRSCRWVGCAQQGMLYIATADNRRQRLVSMFRHCELACGTWTAMCWLLELTVRLNTCHGSATGTRHSEFSDSHTYLI